MDWLNRIIKFYKLEPVEFLEPQKGYRNKSFAFRASDGKWYNLILFKNEIGILDKIKNSNFISNYLAKRHLLVRSSVGKILKLKSKSTVRYVCLYNYLEGKTISWDSYTKKHLKNLGRYLALVHNNLYGIVLNKNLKFIKFDVLAKKQILSMQNYFIDINVVDSLKNKLKIKVDINKIKFNFESIGNIDYKESSVIHLDFVRGNVLFDSEANVTGIIDFEKVCLGRYVVDIARTLAFLLVDCKYKKGDEIRKYFIHKGYVKKGGGFLSEYDLELLNTLVLYFLIYDFYKFLLHNPYEDLKKNEHFLKTLSILISNGYLSIYEKKLG